MLEVEMLIDRDYMLGYLSIDYGFHKSFYHKSFFDTISCLF